MKRLSACRALLSLIVICFCWNLASTQVCTTDVSLTLSASKSVIEGGTATLQCVVTVSGNVVPPNEIEWRHNFLPIINTGNTRYTLSRSESGSTVTFTLAIAEAIRSDTGNYTCAPVISGSICTEHYYLLIDYKLMIFTQDQETPTGEESTLWCLVYVEDATLTWSKLNTTTNTYEAIVSNNRYSTNKVDNLFFLNFTDTTVADSGTYKCSASSSQGQVEEVFEFYSLVAPHNTRISGAVDDNYYGFSGINITIICLSEGVRDPLYNWTVNGMNPVESPDEYAVNSSTGMLIIIDSGLQDIGTYICLAYNSAGSDSIEIYVTIYVNAKILTNPPSIVNVPMGGTANLTVVYEAYPPASFNWYKADQSILITNDTDKYVFYSNGTLLIHDATADDAIYYEVNVCNSIDLSPRCSRSTRTEVNVIFLANPPTNIIINSVEQTDHTVSITWTPPFPDKTKPVDEYVVMVRNSYTNDVYITLDEIIPIIQSNNFTLKKLFPGYTNFFTLLSTNVAGISQLGEEVNVTLDPGAPRINTVSVVTESPSSLNVSFILWHDGGSPLTGFTAQYRNNVTTDNMYKTQPINEQTPYYFVILASLDSSAFYEISVEATNKHGTSEYVTGELLQLPDSVPGKPTLSSDDVKIDSVLLNIQLDDFGTGYLLEYIIQYNSKEDNYVSEVVNVSLVGLKEGIIFMHVVHGLEAQTTYKFSVAAKSTIGTGPYSDEISIYTIEDTSFYYLIISLVAGGAAFIIFCLFLCALVFSCFCFRYGKRREMITIAKRLISPAQDEPVQQASYHNTYTPPLPSPTDTGFKKSDIQRFDSQSSPNVPPILPPRLSEMHDQLDPPTPPGNYSTVRDRLVHSKQTKLDSEHDISDLLMMPKSPTGYKPLVNSEGNLSQTSFITDV